jgi:hypothetical protein
MRAYGPVVTQFVTHDEDNGSEIIYTGHGGRESGRQVADQSFESPGNAALVTSKLTGAPVRVIRGAHRGSAYAPETGTGTTGCFSSGTFGGSGAAVASSFAATGWWHSMRL